MAMRMGLLGKKLGMTQGPLIHVFDVEAFQYEMVL